MKQHLEQTTASRHGAAPVPSQRQTPGLPRSALIMPRVRLWWRRPASSRAASVQRTPHEPLAPYGYCRLKKTLSNPTTFKPPSVPSMLNGRAGYLEFPAPFF
jgi:hypothetical protein